MEEIPRGVHRSASSVGSESGSHSATIQAVNFVMVPGLHFRPPSGASSVTSGAHYSLPASQQTHTAKESVIEFVKSSLATLLLSARYTKSDVISRPRNCCIGVASVFLVVFFTSLVLTAISKTPVVLLRFAEIQVGEMDGLMLAQGGLPFINYTDMEPKIRINASRIKSSTPRWLVKGQIQSSATRQLFQNDNISRPVPTLPTNILIVDSLRERQEGFGRAWPYRQIGYAEAQVFHSALDFINVQANVGDRAMVFIDLQQILSQQGINIANLVGLGNLQNALNSISAVENAIVSQYSNLTNFINTIINAVNKSLQNVTIPPIPTFAPVTVPNFTFPNVTLPGNLTFPPVTLPGNLTLPPVPTLPGNLTLPPLPNFTLPPLPSLPNVSIPDPLSFAVPQMQLTVADSISSSLGKYPSLLGNMIVLDYRHFLEMIVDQSCLDGSQTFSGGPNSLVTAPLSLLQLLGVNSSSLKDFRVLDYTLLVVVLFDNRYNIYYMDLLSRTAELIRISNSWFLAIGIDFAGTVQFPIAVALAAFDGIQTFLGAIFVTIVILIVILGIILVYSLLITNADERKFEVAMLRAMGIAKPQLVSLMTLEALVFILPGVALGVAMLFFINAMIELLLSTFTYAPPQTTQVPIGGLIAGVVLGLLVPIMANWQPISDAMQTSLRDALDIFRQRNTETRVFMIKLAELGLEPWQTLLGWFLVIGGFMVYYLIPYAFVFNNFALFFVVLDLILMVMLLGLCMLSYTTQGVLMRAALSSLMMWGKEKRLHTLILKNMESHKDRNAATFMMFVITSASVIFGGVIFYVLSETLIQAVQLGNGADLQCQSLKHDTPLNHVALDAFLNQNKGIFVAAWAYATYTLESINQVTTRTSVQNSIGTKYSMSVVGVTETFLDAVFPQFCLFSQMDPGYSYGVSGTGVPDVVRSMFEFSAAPQQRATNFSSVYTGYPPNITAPNVADKNNAIIPCILPSAAPQLLGIDAGSYGSLVFSYATNRTSSQGTSFAYRPRAMANRLSGFPGITSLQLLFAAGAMIIPSKNFHQLLNANKLDFPGDLSVSGPDRYRATAETNVSYQNLFIRLQPGLSEGDRTFFVNSLQSQLNPYFHITLDTKSITDDVRTASNLIMDFFYFSAAVAITLCTFMMWISFVSNVQSNAWSYGVLRSLGFTSNQLIRATIYEALTIVISSALVGTSIGLIVGITLATQMNSFLNFPFTFTFPYALFFFTFGMGIVSAVVGSFVPMRRLCARPISSVLKSA